MPWAIRFSAWLICSRSSSSAASPSATSAQIAAALSIDALRVHASPLSSALRVSRDVITALPDALRAQQTAFESTGAIHAAGIFSDDGTLPRLREDVGRHNAVDKAIGAAVIAREPIAGRGLLVTGRISAELAFKGARAGLAWVATPSVPSTLALVVARRSGMVLVGRAVSGTPHVHRPES